MPRILAMADTQIGVQTLDLADQAAVLERIVTLALEREVDLVIHGGDVFEGPVATPEHLRVFLDGVKPLRLADTPLVVLRGNGRHDSATRSVHALDVLNEVPMIEVHDRPGITAHANVGIVTLPWVHPGRLIAQWAGDIDHDQVNDYASKLLVEIAANELTRLRESRFVHDSAILVAHWAISGSALPTGLSVDQMREPLLSWPDLDAIGFDCIIGAHVHEPQQISQPLIDRTLGFVVGSPQQLNFGERGDHGCWILDIEEGASGIAVSTEFVPIPSKRFVTLDFKHDDPAAQIGLSDYIGWDIPQDAVVRVGFTATEEQARRINHAEIRQALLSAGASRVQIEPQVTREARARSEQMTDVLSPSDALVAYCEAEEITVLRARMVSTLREWSEA